MKRPPPPAALDRHALDVARGIANVDRARLRGSDQQYIDILHEAVLAAMLTALDLAATTPARDGKCRTCNGHGMIGGLLPAGGGYDSEPCPTCAEMQTGGGA